MLVPQQHGAERQPPPVPYPTDARALHAVEFRPWFWPFCHAYGLFFLCGSSTLLTSLAGSRNQCEAFQKVGGCGTIVLRHVSVDGLH